jgi:hypothetical protein
VLFEIVKTETERISSVIVDPLISRPTCRAIISSVQQLFSFDLAVFHIRGHLRGAEGNCKCLFLLEKHLKSLAGSAYIKGEGQSLGYL